VNNGSAKVTETPEKPFGTKSPKIPVGEGQRLQFPKTVEKSYRNGVELMEGFTASIDTEVPD
jgi:hypothetical protein